MKYWLMAIELMIAILVGIRQKSFEDGFIAFLFCHFIWGVSNNNL